MTSKTSSAELLRETGNVFRWQFRRTLPLAVLYAALLLLAYPLFRFLDRQAFGMAEIGSLDFATFGTVLMALLLPAIQGGYLFSRRQADLFHALPLRRDALFCGNFLSGLVCLIVPLLFAFGADASAALGRGQMNGYQVFKLLSLLGPLCLLAVLTLAFFTLAAVCSGTYWEYAINSVLLTICWPLFLQLFDHLAWSTIPGGMFRYDGPYLSAAGSPPLAVLILRGTYGSQFPLWSFLWWAALTVGLLALGVLANRRRDSENAGAPLPRSPLKSVLRVAGCTVAGLAGASAALGRSAAPALVLAAAFLILLAAWGLSELLYYQGFRQLRRHLPGLGCSLGLLAAVFLSVSLGMGQDTAVPEASEITLVSVWYNGSAVSPEYFSAAVEEEDGFWVPSGMNMLAGVQSPENLEKAERLQKKLVELERTCQYPYLPGQALRSDGPHTITLCYYPAEGLSGSRRKAFAIPVSELPEKARSLYGECVTLADEITRSEEYVKGMYPVNAVDAAMHVSRTLGPAVSEEEAAIVPEGSASPVNAGPQLEYRELSGLPDEAQFRKKLEAALLDDLTHGRYPRQTDLARSGGNETGAFQIWYEIGHRFLARGGILDGEPAQGRDLVFADSVYSDDRSQYGETAVPFRIYPQMTATYSLLETLYEP